MAREPTAPLLRMRWARLLFVHWRVDPPKAARLLPPGIELETYDGSAWVGLVPFRMEGVTVKGLRWLLGERDFYECNVRTYVRRGGERGVWFMSLDAEHLPTVIGARLHFGLNYRHSRFSVQHRGDVTHYALRRRRADRAGLRIAWEALEPLPPAAPGSLEEFLTDRLVLFGWRRGRLVIGHVAHPPWPLRRARLLEIEDELVLAAGLAPEGEPHLLASDGVDTVGFPPRAVDPDAPADAATDGSAA